MRSVFSPSPCLGLLAALAATQPAMAASSVELGQVLITDEEQNDLTAASERLREVPGASNLVDMQRAGQGRVASNQDVLAYQPGVFAQSAGNDGIKLSIRGSGINRAPGAHGSGVYTMFDGLPLTGPGGTPYELFEPLWLSRAEVLRGANGFDQGALALGGAINYVTHTGYDAAPLQVRYEVGSRGYQHRHIVLGQVLGNLDYYVALTDSEYDGYQAHSSGSAKGFAANVGYRFNPNLETRFYLRYRETENELAGRLTKDQIKHHPRAANPAYLARDDSRPQPGSTWVGNKTTFYLDDDARLEAGLVYHDYPMDLREGPMRLKVAYTDVSGTLNYFRRDTLFGHESKTTVGWRTTKHLPNSGASQFARNGDVSGARTRDFTYQGSDTVLHVGNDLELAPDLWLTTGLAMIYTRRESDVTYPAEGGKVSMHDWDYAPRLGLRYDIRPDLQVYGNLSRSVEPPHPWSLIWSAPSTGGKQIQPIEMQNQTATTLGWAHVAIRRSAAGTLPGTTRKCATNCWRWKWCQTSLRSSTPALPCTRAWRPASTAPCGNTQVLASSACARPTPSATSTTVMTTRLATTACPASPCTTTRPNCAMTGRAGSTQGSTRKWRRKCRWTMPTVITPMNMPCSARAWAGIHRNRTGRPGWTCAT